MRDTFLHRKSKKGQMTLASLLPAIVTLAVVIIAVSLFAEINTDVKATHCDAFFDAQSEGCFTDSGLVDKNGTENAAFNVSGQGGQGLVNLSQQFGNIGTIIAIVVIIALLVGAFVVFNGR